MGKGGRTFKQQAQIGKVLLGCMGGGSTGVMGEAQVQIPKGETRAVKGS